MDNRKIKTGSQAYPFPVRLLEAVPRFPGTGTHRRPFQRRRRDQYAENRHQRQRDGGSEHTIFSIYR